MEKHSQSFAKDNREAISCYFFLLKNGRNIFIPEHVKEKRVSIILRKANGKKR